MRQYSVVWSSEMLTSTACTPAFGGQRGFVGSTMGEPSVVLEGVEGPDAAASLFSTVHGAGRAMSRNQAAGKPRKRWRNNVRDDTTLYRTREEALAGKQLGFGDET